MNTIDKIVIDKYPPKFVDTLWNDVSQDEVGVLKKFVNGEWKPFLGGGNSNETVDNDNDNNDNNDNNNNDNNNNILVVRPVEDYHEVDMGDEGTLEDAALVDTDFNTIVEAYKSGKVIIYSDTNLLDDDEPANYLLGYAETYEDKSGLIEVDWLYFYSVPFNSGGGSQVSSRRLCIIPYGDNTYADRLDDNGWSIGQLM